MWTQCERFKYKSNHLKKGKAINIEWLRAHMLLLYAVDYLNYNGNIRKSVLELCKPYKQLLLQVLDKAYIIENN